MAKLTQQEKITQLQLELQQQYATNNELIKKIYEMQQKADKEFVNSPYKSQLEDELFFLHEYKKLYESERENRIKQQGNNVTYAKRIQELNSEIDMLKESKPNRYNERGAGRKSTITLEIKKDIMNDRLNRMTIKDISQKYNYSVGTIHKLINEINL